MTIRGDDSNTNLLKSVISQVEQTNKGFSLYANITSFIMVNVHVLMTKNVN